MTLRLFAALLALMPAAAFAQDRPALSDADKESVIKWIAHQVSDARQPYCYRRSEGRGVGTPLSACPAGKEKNGALCYEACREGFYGVGPVCWAHCPAGYTDTGALCTRPASSHHIDIHSADCPHGFHNTGTSCYRTWPPKSESLSHSTCPAGMERKGAFCYSVCPSGYTNTGVSCYRGPDTVAKRSYARDAGSPMVCAAGLQEQAGLCYKGCASGFHGVGPVCWQNCEAGRKECGAGCAIGTKACVADTANMVVAPIAMAVSIFTGGASSEVAESYSAVKKAIQVAKEAKAVANYAYQVGRTVDSYVGDYLKVFSRMTTPEVERQIDARFSPQAQAWIKRQYALQHMHLMLQQDNLDAALNTINAASGFDPTGVTGVISAFAQPRCSLVDPFPSVRPLY